MTFLSTPSAGRATAGGNQPCHCCTISIHALRGEGDPLPAEQSVVFQQISIHALRGEGDWLCLTALPPPTLFLSTPSAGRATVDGEQLIEIDKLFLSTPSAGRATPARAA